MLLDYVPNHASTESDYFKKSEAREAGYENYFVWADPRPDPTGQTRLVPSNWVSYIITLFRFSKNVNSIILIPIWNLFQVSQFGGSVWQWSENRQQFYLHQFAVEQADFNFREQAVRDEMIKIMTFWIAEGADGFRVDAIPHLFETAPDANGIYPDERISGNMFLTPDQIGYTTQEHIRDLPELYDVVYEWRKAVDDWKEANGSETK